jgi:dTDP-L-rhamnose 4-epimerase
LSTSILITGGAGFIGCALARRLVTAGYDVAVMDALHPQVHTGPGRPTDLPASVPLLYGDVTHAPDWEAVLRMVRPAQVVHLAAETGTGQSLSEATRHGSVNVVGTTQLLDALTRAGLVPRQLVLASSRAVYGEGAWRSGEHVFYPGPRTHAQLVAGLWDPEGPIEDAVVPLPSSSVRTEARPTNIYAATKLAQEHMLLAWTAARGSALSVLRLQNVYGPGQSLTNPYTGIVSLFGRLARAQRPLEVYEDGRIVRDFVFIEDVVEALAAAVERPAPQRRLLDIGSGAAITIHDLARRMAALCDAPEPTVVGRFRDGDVRAASCDIEPAVAELSWHPEWPLDRGLPALLEWIDGRVKAAGNRGGS